MNRLCLVMLLAALSVALSPGATWRPIGSLAEAAEVSAKEAFQTAKDLGTVEAWEAFLASYPTGFHADLARAYLKKLGGDGSAATNTEDHDAIPEKTTQPAKREAKTKPAAAPVAAAPGAPAIARSAKYMGFPEKFNRYYTDSDWKPSRIVYVSPDGSGDGATRGTPASVAGAIAEAAPGTEVYFLRGTYKGCFEMSGSGTYNEPIVLYGERNDDKTLGVSIACCTSGRHTCFNIENADYVAVDGFEMTGGKYGVRVVGAGYQATEHARGVAVLNCRGHDQSKDPFFSGQADWTVWERNVGSGAKKEDGHGIYISNGSDWNIVRFNETYGNSSSDFQINADPISTCKGVGIAFDDPRCAAYAGTDGGGQGASDYFLIDGNYFHDSNVGANFTSVRRSVVRNNVFGPQERHNVSFWQETDNPQLGSSENKILHNLFLTTGNHGVKFENNSKDNEFANNVLMGIQLNDGEASANPAALLMEVDATSAGNVFRGNMYVSGTFEGRAPESDETVLDDFASGWFTNFPTALSHDANDFAPTAEAPFLGKGELSSDAPADRNGTARKSEVDLGPIEVR
jgi:hypothetical protein